MTQSINYSKVIMSLGLIVFVAAMVVSGTGAFFSDTETSTGNVFTAGSLDLKVDNVAHYNGMICFDSEFTDGTAWHPADTLVWNETDEVYELVDTITDAGELNDEIDTFNADNPAFNPAAGDACASTWAETDLGPQTFFQFADLKPGDNGENTISLHVYDNDAYACAIIDNMVDGENGLTEPEADVDTTADEGELSQELRFFAWSDDGDNVWEPEDDEVELFSNIEGPASDVIDGVVYPLFTPDTGVLQATTTEYIGLYWCYGDITVGTTNDSLSCDGSGVSNMTQTDSLTTDFTFYVEQARNNEGFQCPQLGDVEPDSDRVSVGAVLGTYATPAPENCELTVDPNATADDVTLFNTITAAEAAATDGQTICVDSGTYVEDVTVDVPNVTILGLNDPKGVDAATVEGRMDIDVDGVTVSGLAITNPDVGYGIVIDGANDTEISFNTFTSIGDGAVIASAQAIYYDGNPGAANGLLITNNMIDSVGSDLLDTAAGSGSSAKGIFIGDSTSPDPLTGLVIEDNMISNIESDRGGYGILVNYGVGSTGSVPGLLVENNTIETVTGAWVHAIGLETDTPTAVVALNAISDLNSGSIDSSGVFFEGNPNSDVLVNTNNFAPGVPFGVALHPSNPAIAVNAENNWWGDLDPSDNIGENAGTIDFTPFEVSAFPQN